MSANKHEVIIYYSSDDEAFIAEVPELSGCMADSKTHLDALKQIEKVANEWLETAELLGREIPEPRGKLEYT